MQRGGRRLLIIPPSKTAGPKGILNNAPASETLVLDVEIQQVSWLSCQIFLERDKFGIKSQFYSFDLNVLFTKVCMKENILIEVTCFTMCTSPLSRFDFLLKGHQKVLNQSLWILHPLYLQIVLVLQPPSQSAGTALRNRRGRLQYLCASSRGWHVDDGCEYELSECSLSHLRDQRTKSNSPNEKLKVGDFFFPPTPPSRCPSPSELS